MMEQLHRAELEISNKIRNGKIVTFQSPMRYTVKEKSQKSEKKAALYFGGRPQPASGALRHAKGDVKTPTHLIEDKITDNKSFPLSKSLWEKIRLEAFNQRRTPMMRITIQGVTLCVMAEDEAKRLMQLEKQDD